MMAGAKSAGSDVSAMRRSCKTLALAAKTAKRTRFACNVGSGVAEWLRIATLQSRRRLQMSTLYCPSRTRLAFPTTGLSLRGWHSYTRQLRCPSPASQPATLAKCDMHLRTFGLRAASACRTSQAHLSSSSLGYHNHVSRRRSIYSAWTIQFPSFWALQPSTLFLRFPQPLPSYR